MAKHHPDLIFCRKQPGVGKNVCVLLQSSFRSLKWAIIPSLLSLVVAELLSPVRFKVAAVFTAITVCKCFILSSSLFSHWSTLWKMWDRLSFWVFFYFFEFCPSVWLFIQTNFHTTSLQLYQFCLLQATENVWFVILTFDRTPWWEFAMSATTDHTRDDALFVVDLGCQTHITAKNVQSWKRT